MRLGPRMGPHMHKTLGHVELVGGDWTKPCPHEVDPTEEITSARYQCS